MRKTFTKVEFDRLTDLLCARTVESDPPKSIVSREENNEESIRIDGIGGSTLCHMDLDDSLVVKMSIERVFEALESLERVQILINLNIQPCPALPSKRTVKEKVNQIFFRGGIAKNTFILMRCSTAM